MPFADYDVRDFFSQLDLIKQDSSCMFVLIESPSLHLLLSSDVCLSIVFQFVAFGTFDTRRFTFAQSNIRLLTSVMFLSRDK